MQKLLADFLLRSASAPLQQGGQQFVIGQLLAQFPFDKENAAAVAALIPLKAR